MVVNGQSSPAVTVIIPTYNWSTVLPYSIGSVLDQTFTDFELLVIGDRCTDDSEQVVTSINDARVTWRNLSVRTKHQSGPNNAGIEAARGEIIAYLGHDDLWLPHHLEALVAAIQGGASMAHGRTLNVVPGRAPEVFPFRFWPYLPGAWIPPTAMAHTRELVLRAGGWRPPSETETHAPEADLWRRMATIGGRPRLLSRLTNVKFPAARRPGVYKDQPSEEQARWLRRIRQADDPERTLLQLSEGDGPTRTLARAVRARVRLRTRMQLNRLPMASAAESAARDRRYKGIEE